MAITESTPRAGDNSGDPHAAAYADIEARVAALSSAGDVWEKRDDFTETDAQKANDFITGAKRLKREADKAREAEKAPHLQAGRYVDTKWKKFDGRIDKVIALVAPKLAAFLAKKEAERRAAAELERQKAAEAAAAADAARMDAANAASASARMEAEELAEEHARMADVAADKAEDLSGKTRIASATGLANTRSLRTIRRPEIVSLPQALSHYRDRSEIAEAIRTLAAAELRHAPTIDGVKQVPNIPGIRARNLPYARARRRRHRRRVECRLASRGCR